MHNIRCISLKLIKNNYNSIHKHPKYSLIMNKKKLGVNLSSHMHFELYTKCLKYFHGPMGPVFDFHVQYCK